MDTIDVKYLIDSDLQINEAYKTLRSRIQMFGSNIKKIGFTSCKDNLKSLVAIHLGASIAEAGKKVILVVADNNSAILSDKPAIYLLSDSTEEELIYHTDIDNLDLTISEFVYINFSPKTDHEKFAEFIKKAEETYDYIFLDIPPLEALTYKAEMAKVCDGMILVIKENTVDYKTGQRAKTMLEKSECPILGAVLLQEA